MKRAVLTWSLLLIANASSEDERVEGRNNEFQQIKLWSEKFEKSSRMENLEKVEFLALGLRNMGYRKTREDHSKEVDELYEKIQTALLAIPGHAEYYRDRVNQARIKVNEANKAGSISEIAHYRGLLSDEFMYGFPTLAQLPSHETVRVLGEFLSDERGYVPPPPEPTSFEQLVDADVDKPVFNRAASVLGQLPLMNKPIPSKTRYETPEDVIPWRQWYEEIKSGNRTFCFEGDPTEYDLNGPASKELIQRVKRDPKRDEERAVGHRKSPPATESAPTVTQTGKPSLIAWVVAAFGLIGAAVWYFRRNPVV